MIQYIYFVKCPGCEDEHFDFFDEAKEFALSCLSQKPIITQTEINRNDFGECTDHCDLGTVWSWEDTMQETTAEPAKSIFTKDDLKHMANEEDPEFNELDNSIEPEINEISERRPIPEGMTIEQLVEEMEENEDEVECALCNELFAKADCHYDEDEGYICPQCAEDTVKCTWCGFRFDPGELRKEVDLGWLCDRCEAAIKSRGEKLTFEEGSYWDFLDEDTNSSKAASTWICVFDGQEIGAVEAVTEEEAYLAMERKYPEYPYGLYDGVAKVWPNDTLEESQKKVSKLEELEEAADYRNRLSLCPECGDEHSYDQETSFCLNCGFN
jgi:hypothetical protein